MHKKSRLFHIVILLALVLSTMSACQKQTPPADPNLLYVNITWHQHQPLYYQDADGIYTRPWVRVHATKDYLDMAEKVAQYPDVHVTFNFTPSLIRQLNELAAGTKDIYWVLGEKEVSELTTDEKQFILERFFDANWNNIIAIYPRYQALLDKRGGTSEEAIQAALTAFTDQDFLDLQVWFNLAWFDPTYLAEEPLLALVQKGENFDQADKQIVFDKALEIVQEVLPYHAELQRQGQIEVTTTPYAHPILPLIYNNQLALVGNPSAIMPEKTFAYPEDAAAHLDLSVQMYEENFGTSVRGLWPGEGAVAEEIIPLVAEAGYTFMQTGEPVLAKSLGIDSFTRDSQGYVQEADLLYRPYFVTDDNGDQVAMFFRDWTLSDKIGFDYSQMSGEAAAQDMVGHLEQIQADFLESDTPGPHIVSIILDGENAWENYPGDGNDFFNALYQKLSDSEVLQTVTPSEYLEMFPEQQTLDYLFPGAWFSANYDTWIGEEEEAIAWDYLATTREDLAAYESGAEYTAEENLAQAFDFMYLAEGSDWFWWYGADQDSGQDSYFDEGYRALLAGVYNSLGVEVPPFVKVPIVQAPVVQPDVAFTGLSTPEMTATVDDPAWDTAALYLVAGDSAVNGFNITMDEENLYLRVATEGNIADQQIGFYFAAPNVEGGKTAFALDSELVLQFFANTLLQWDGSANTLDLYGLTDSEWTVSQAGVGAVATGDGVAEFKIPIESLGGLNVGTYLKFGVVVGPEGDLFPTGGPARMLIPSLGETTMILEVQDPVGDDDGPGSYLYPTDGVFADSVFDVDHFSVGSDGINLVFTFDFVGPVENSWNSSNGLSVQTLDVYIDTDPGAGTGARMLMPGRNAALQEGYGWEYAIWAEGWTPQVVMVDPDTLEPKEYTEATGGMTVVVDSANNQVVVRVPLSFLPEGNPADWGYAAAVLGQEGYPTEGVWRVRDVSTYPAQYLFGGGPADSNHTRIIDLIVPEGQSPTQEEWLSNYPSTVGSLDDMTPDDFPQVPVMVQ